MNKPQESDEVRSQERFIQQRRQSLARRFERINRAMVLVPRDAIERLLDHRYNAAGIDEVQEEQFRVCARIVRDLRAAMDEQEEIGRAEAVKKAGEVAGGIAQTQATAGAAVASA